MQQAQLAVMSVCSVKLDWWQELSHPALRLENAIDGSSLNSAGQNMLLHDMMKRDSPARDYQHRVAFSGFEWVNQLHCVY